MLFELQWPKLKKHKKEVNRVITQMVSITNSTNRTGSWKIIKTNNKLKKMILISSMKMAILTNEFLNLRIGKATNTINNHLIAQLSKRIRYLRNLSKDCWNTLLWLKKWESTVWPQNNKKNNAQPEFSSIILRSCIKVCTACWGKL